MKKIFILITLSLIVLQLSACKDQTIEAQQTPELIDHTNNSNENSETSQKTDDDSQVVVEGDIVRFDERGVHIVQGDMINIYEYDNEDNSDFYTGQHVKLVKDEKGTFLKAVIKENYVMTHTSMGDAIHILSGEITAIEDEFFKLYADEKEYQIMSSYTKNLSMDDNVTVYAIFHGEEIISILTINENLKLTAEITGLIRTEEGDLLVECRDEKQSAYSINLSRSYLEFDISSTKIGDTLTIYHQGIKESHPAQVETLLIKK